jgi:DNA-binding LacI/PurR family transcriptional regulator
MSFLLSYGEITETTSTESRARPATVRDVAKLAGVSTATVSRVVNGTSNVSNESTTKVLSAISQLQYCPNANAAELARGNRNRPKLRGIQSPALAGTRATGSSELLTNA